jgi:hypothetical protein
MKAEFNLCAGAEGDILFDVAVMYGVGILGYWSWINGAPGTLERWMSLTARPPKPGDYSSPAPSKGSSAASIFAGCHYCSSDRD